nr:hypothetical protein [Bacteroidota bacterium]
MRALVLLVIVPLPGAHFLLAYLNEMNDPEKSIKSGLSIIKNYERKGRMVHLFFAKGLGQSVLPFREDPVQPYVTLVKGLLVIGTNEHLVFGRDVVLERLKDSFTQKHFDDTAIDLREKILPYLDDVELLKGGQQISEVLNDDLFPRDEFWFPYDWEFGRWKLGLS